MPHLIDRLGALTVANGPHRLRFFTDGWGAEQHLGDLGLRIAPAEPVTIEWVHHRSTNGCAVSVGMFDSPASHVLPPPSRLAVVIRIAPDPAPINPRPTVVLMAAWNEHDSRARFDLAARLARRGIASLVLENPYYGVRRPGEGQPIKTVVDFARMGTGAVTEGRALLATIREEGGVPGVSGYSMGGNIAALISATMTFPVATAPLAAPHSPAPVYLDGALRGGIDWEALGGETIAAPRLRSFMLRASVTTVPPANHTGHAVIVAADSDGYVPREATEVLHRHWPGSELRWIRAGHATLFWFGRRLLADAIVDSFSATEAAG